MTKEEKERLREWCKNSDINVWFEYKPLEELVPKLLDEVERLEFIIILFEEQQKQFHAQINTLERKLAIAKEALDFYARNIYLDNLIDEYESGILSFDTSKHCKMAKETLEKIK